MNQQCKVCGEPAAGFHFGAFTCEGCKSFFGRSYNNLASIQDCKNNGVCVINKKNRTACKACRLKKCLAVGMSKSGSRYGRRSNWFKIHCILQDQQHQQQEQQQQQQQQQDQNGTAGLPPSIRNPRKTPPPHIHHPLRFLNLHQHVFSPPSLLHLQKTKEDLMFLGFDEYKHSTSPAISSPESHNSDSSVEFNDARRMPMFPHLLPNALLPPTAYLLPTMYNSMYADFLQTTTNNRLIRNHNSGEDTFNKRVMLDAVLQSQRSPTPEEMEIPAPEETPIPQNDPIDLSMKPVSEKSSSPAASECSGRGAGSEADEESCDSENEVKNIKLLRPTPLDLTRKV